MELAVAISPVKKRTSTYRYGEEDIYILTNTKNRYYRLQMRQLHRVNWKSSEFYVAATSISSMKLLKNKKFISQ